MKRSVKVVLVIVVVFIGIILVDTFVARVFKNSPILSVKEDLGSGSYVRRGVIIDTFYCVREQDIMEVSWHFKGVKFTCPIEEVTNAELEEVNNRIVEYFVSPEYSYKNLSYNYVDYENKVVVVGLIDNSENEQKRFKEEVINSEVIMFVQSEGNVNYNEEKMLLYIGEVVVSRLGIDGYDNFASCEAHPEKNKVIVVLVNNSDYEQEWFRKNIVNSPYIVFEEGGPYTAF